MSTAERIIAAHQRIRAMNAGPWYCRECGRGVPLPTEADAAAHVVAALNHAGKQIVDLPEVRRPEWYDAEVPIDGPGLNGARVVRDGDQVSFLGVPCPIQTEVVPVFAAALLAVHQDAARVAEGGDRRG